MTRLVQRILIATITLAFLVGRAHAQTAVTACDQVVVGDGYLPGDLNCPSDAEAAVQVRPNGSLDLRGFSIHGGKIGVLCSDEEIVDPDGFESYPYSPCRVFGGGGTVDGQGYVAIVASRLGLTDITVASDAITLIIHKSLSFKNVNLQLGPAALGIMAAEKARLFGTGLTLTGGTGIQYGRKIKIDGVTASGYTYFAKFSGSVKLEHASLTGGAEGVAARVVTLKDSVVTGHSGTAIEASRIGLERSSVTGNALDLHADRRPKLDPTSTCETSNGWGVCTND